MLFGCQRQNINHSSEKLHYFVKVISLHKALFLFYAIIDNQFETRELESIEKLVEQPVQALQSC